MLESVEPGRIPKNHSFADSVKQLIGLCSYCINESLASDGNAEPLRTTILWLMQAIIIF